MAPLSTSLTIASISSTIAAPAIITNSTSSIPEEQINPIALIMVVMTSLFILAVMCMISISIIILKLRRLLKLRRHHNDRNNKARDSEIESVKRPMIKPLHKCLLASILVCPCFLASTLSPLRVSFVEQLEGVRSRKNILLDPEGIRETAVGIEMNYGTLATSSAAAGGSTGH